MEQIHLVSVHNCRTESHTKLCLPDFAIFRKYFGHPGTQPDTILPLKSVLFHNSLIHQEANVDNMTFVAKLNLS